jgi:hypothetical protein
MKLAVSDYELGKALAEKLGSLGDSTLVLRALFFLGVILINPSGTRVLIEISTHFKEELPSCVNDPKGFARATKKVRRETRNWCLQNNLKESWSAELALLFVCMARWFTESGDSRAGMFARAFPSETSQNILQAKKKRRRLLNDEPVSVEIELWFPHFETRKERRLRILKGVAAQIDRLDDAREQEALRAGLVPSNSRKNSATFTFKALASLIIVASEGLRLPLST